MRNSIKNFISCVITFSLIVLTTHKIGVIVSPNMSSELNAIDTFHDMPENTIEVIGYGSSHMWRGLSSMEMYEKYGIGAYNYGCNWQNINTTLLFLKDSLRYQSPKIVLIETYHADSLSMNTNITGEIYYTRRISEFEGKWEYLKQCFGDDMERYLSYYMPLCAFHDNWINLEKTNFSKRVIGKGYYKNMGFVKSTHVFPVTIEDPSTFEQEELNENALAVLDEIVSICNDNNIDIIFYTAPYQGAYSYGEAMTRYAEENDCIYFNLFEMMDEVGFDCETDFCDEGHLNNSGSVKVADFLGEYIVDHYDVTDMRTVEGNIWEVNSKE